MKNVTASIVLYKHSYEDIKLTLDCLISSPYIVQIILIDNGGAEWVEGMKLHKVKYTKSQGNYGFGYGHNIAIKKYADSGDFFLICNPDIHFDQNEFHKLIDFAETRTEGLFLPKIVYPSGENQFGARLLPSPLNLFARRFSSKLAEKLDQNYLLKDLDLSKPYFVPYLSGCFMLFKSNCLLELDGFDERFFMYMEDIDLSRRCAEKFGTIYYPLATVIHHHEQASYKNAKLLKAHLESAIKYFHKWGWFFDPSRDQLNTKCLDQGILKSNKQ